MVVIYDACVLYPAPLRDFLVELALGGLFQAKWTNRIHNEWIENLLQNRPDLKRDQLERTRHLMNSAVLDCLVEDYDHSIKSIELPDKNDRHVLAAAIHSHADGIITFNLKDFPAKALQPYKLRAIHPDDFIKGLMDQNERAVRNAARMHRRRLRRPPFSEDDYLLSLARSGLVKTVELLKNPQKN